MNRDDIKRVAYNHGTNLKQISERMGITSDALQKTLQAVDRGGTTIGTLERIAEAIGCSPAEFYGVTPSGCHCPHCGALITVTLS